MIKQSSCVVIYSCIGILLALLVVGYVSHGILRHIVQTLPIWLILLLGLRNSPFTKWAALPFFLFWLALMSSIWLYLLGWATLISGTFSGTEILMTVVVGCCSIIGIVSLFVFSSPRIHVLKALAVALFVASRQIILFRISMLSPISHD